MDLTPERYQKMVKRAGPSSPLGTHCLWAFGVGGAICTLGEGLRQLYLSLGWDQDAAGALSHPQREAGILAERFPRHAALAQKHGLFSGENPLIREVFCCGEAQSAPISLPCPVWDFSVERALGALPARQRKRLLRFFLPRPLKTQADTILLTQQFSNLGLLGEG